MGSKLNIETFRLGLDMFMFMLDFKNKTALSKFDVIWSDKTDIRFE